MLAIRQATNFGTKHAPAGATYSVFQSFAEGAVPAGSIAVVRADGSTLSPQQADNRVNWPDGSLKCAVFTWRHPVAIAPGASDSIDFVAVPGGWDNAMVVPLSPLTTHDYKMEIVAEGVTYTLRLNNEIGTRRHVTTTRSGRAASGFKVWGDFRNGPNPSDPIHGQLWGTAYVEAYLDNTFRVWFEAHCNKITASKAIPVSSYALRDGERVLFAHETPFTFFTCNKIACLDGDGTEHYSGPDTSRVVWAFPLPVFGDRATTGLYDAYIVWWNYWTPSYIANFPSHPAASYAPNLHLEKIFVDAVDGTGNHNWLGPLASYSVKALLKGDYATLRHDRMHALGAWGVCLYWVKDPETGYPPVLNDRTYRGLSRPMPHIGWALGAALPMTGGHNPATTGDSSHAALWSWYQYLATGREWWLENIMEQAVGVIGCDAVGDAKYQRNPTFNGRKYYGTLAAFPQQRACAWELRNLSNAHWVTPDRHPMKPYLNDLVQTQYDSASDYMTENAREWAALAQWRTGGPVHPEYLPVDNPWMGSYLATSICMDVRRGRIGRDHKCVDHVVRHIYGKMVDGNFYNAAGAYRLGDGIGPNPAAGTPMAQRWSDVYGFQDPPNLTHPLIDTPPVRTGLRNHRDPNGGANPPTRTYVGHTYENLSLCAAHCGVMAGLGPYARKVVDYLTPYIDENSSEALWGRTEGAQAWRIRAPSR